MRVVYDISTLGWGYRSTHARTGIYRTVENVARGLKSSKECELTFSAIGSFRMLAQCMDYLDSNPDLKTIPIKYDGFEPDAVRRLSRFAQRMNGGSKRSLASRALRKISNTGINLIEATRKPHKQRPLESTQIFHSSQFPLPPRTQNGSKVKRFLTVYDLIPLIYPQLSGSGFASLFQKIINSITPDDWIICISNTVRDDVCNHLGLDPARVFVAPLAAEKNLFYPCRDEHKYRLVKDKYSIPESPYILSLGSLEPRKNLKQTVDSFTKLVTQERIKDLSLVVVGEKSWGFESAFEKVNELESVRDRVVFTGYVNDEDLAPLYGAASAFVYPSLCEGFGLPPLEAMQCGVPVVCSSATSLPEVVGDAAILVDPGDTDAWCQSLLDLYMKPLLREELSQKSLQRAQLFSWERCTDNVLASYRTALDN
jgi:glycosyltransferase involved in cell wall biosynthesis